MTSATQVVAAISIRRPKRRNGRAPDVPNQYLRPDHGVSAVRILRGGGFRASRAAGLLYATSLRGPAATTDRNADLVIALLYESLAAGRGVGLTTFA